MCCNVSRRSPALTIGMVVLASVGITSAIISIATATFACIVPLGSIWVPILLTVTIVALLIALINLTIVKVALIWQRYN